LLCAVFGLVIVLLWYFWLQMRTSSWYLSSPASAFSYAPVPCPALR